MFQRLLSNTIHFKRKEISNVIEDINLFYSYLRQNNLDINDWYFDNIFTLKYHNYLHNYSWLNKRELDYLQQGILNLILFKYYRGIGETSTSVNKNVLRKVTRVIAKHNPPNPITQKLQTLVLNALKSGVGNHNNYIINDNDILKSINWSLQNIILTEKPYNNNKRTER